MALTNRVTSRVGSIDDDPESLGSEPSLSPVRSSGDGTTEVPIAFLRVGCSPRLNGVDDQHIRVLAALDAELPPILIDRSTMRVIDGMHRLRAAAQNGRSRIRVEFFDGTEEEAFLAGVRANVAHGLPLTLADRRAAAGRIIRSMPQLSDRSIAASAGLAARTVAAIRRQHDASSPATTGRIGLDGRVRPLKTAEGRRLACEIIAARPNASLREIAREAGISVGTARDVRQRVQAGADPVPSGAREPQAVALPARIPQDSSGRSAHLILRRLSQDPSLRYSEAGRKVLQWLSSRVLKPAEWKDVIEDVPPHTTVLVSQIARECAAEWYRLASELELRSSGDVTQADFL
ncbi:ParB N-terminal domain-containing protein [Streptomyces sp. NPDC056661]|uniref:ParB/RepB/Spo0J family partition protein n=1 Tax=Streptomyces sp. NPDC056661 TaxID=3345898 RepID=UPI00367F3F16